jgi:type II secretory pathway component PulF
LNGGQAGYLIQAAPNGIPGQAVMVPLEALADEASRTALKNATNNLLSSVAQGRQDLQAMQSWDVYNPTQKIQFINSTNDKDILGKLLQRETNGQVALIMQQKLNYISALEAAAQPQ